MYDCIISPVVTEKSTNLSEQNKIVKADDIPYKEGPTDFTISFWLYIDKYRSTTMGSKYPILEKISNNITNIVTNLVCPIKNFFKLINISKENFLL